MIRFQCPGCQATYTVGDEKAGKQGKCPKCQSAFVIPGAEAGLAPPPSAFAPPPPPPAAEEDGVEISPCPKCGTRLTVSPGDIGLNVQCPSCSTTFQATRPGAMAPVPQPPATRDEEEYRPARRRRRDDEEDDRDDRPVRRRKSRSGMVQLKRIDILSAGKVVGAMYAFMALIIFIIYAVIILALTGLGAAAAGGRGGGGGVMAMGMLFTCGAVVIGPIFYGIMGFIGGVLGALIYNFIASMIGGLEFELD